MNDDGAVQNAIANPELSEGTMRWFEVVETRGHSDDGQIVHRHVRVKIGVTLGD